ncbi:MAG TPA: MGMT family protein [Candidatus Krumholzibacteria bacterium]|nr:MGMT family protein [Candidatus Krumholzibacteria bacterium]
MAVGVRHEIILAAVEAIPHGRVATYGQVAEAAGLPGRARLVGRVLRELPDRHPAPWYRVVGAGGRLSLGGDGRDLQRLLLEDEGVVFLASGRIDLETFGWRG